VKKSEVRVRRRDSSVRREDEERRGNEQFGLKKEEQEEKGKRWKLKKTSLALSISRSLEKIHL